MAELIPYSYSDHVISPFLLFYEKRIVLFFSSSYLKTGKTTSLLLLFFHMKLLFSGKGLLGLFQSVSAPSENGMWKNKQQCCIMWIYVLFCVKIR